MDAISDGGAYGLTLIAFVGSVFSPYYAWSGRQTPENHCAINVALYGPRKARWAMTERGADALDRSPEHFSVGPSNLHWDGDRLRIDINERCTPLPSRLRGQVTVHTDYRLDNPVQIDGAGQHVWYPISPHARVDLNFDSPDLSWSGDGYLDSNIGHEPLENRFRFWDWSRGRSGPNETTILYNTDMYDGRKRRIAMQVSDTGDISLPQSPELTDLPPTPIFRIARRTAGSNTDAPRVIRTLEDTPFYSRSVIENTVFGQRFPAVHESLSGPRLRSSIVKMMLPFRMPRRA